MKKSQITARHVAERAGVSTATVSPVRYETGSGKIACQRVIRAAREMDSARSLAGRHSDIRGFILLKPHQQIFDDPDISYRTIGLYRAAQQRAGEMSIDPIHGHIPVEPHVKLQGASMVRESCGANRR